MNQRIPVLDHGYVELLDVMGGDLSVVNGARQSFDDVSQMHFKNCGQVLPKHVSGSGKECACDSFPILEERFNGSEHGRTHLSLKDAGLINFLMREKHTSPFEQVQVQFAVQLPIFVAREWMRHRTQSFNEMSGRYAQLPRLFYVPDRDQIREQKGNPGAYFYELMEDDAEAVSVIDAIKHASNTSFNEYEDMLDRGVAKEVARLVLPVNTYTKFVVSANLLNWMRFLSLRNHEHAQWEIKQYAIAIEDLLRSVAPVAMECFEKHGRLR